MINNDIPWNPVRLDQRMGRIHRYGQEKDCLIVNFVATNTREGRVMEKLFDRVRAIERDLDPKGMGTVFNVLGDVHKVVIQGKPVERDGQTFDYKMMLTDDLMTSQAFPCSIARAVLKSWRWQRGLVERSCTPWAHGANKRPSATIGLAIVSSLHARSHHAPRGHPRPAHVSGNDRLQRALWAARHLERRRSRTRPRIIPISLSSLLWLRLAKEVVPVLFADTDPQAEAVLINLLRQASPARKLAMVGELNNTVRTLALAGLRQRFPAAGSAELQRRLADLLLGVDLARQVYGPLTRESVDDH